MHIFASRPSTFSRKKIFYLRSLLCVLASCAALYLSSGAGAVVQKSKRVAPQPATVRREAPVGLRTSPPSAVVANSDVTAPADLVSSFVVNTTADSDDDACAPLGTGNGCTLREAVRLSNADPGAETITFDIPTTDPGYDAGAGRYTINLLTGTAMPPDVFAALHVLGDLTITGPGAGALTVRRSADGGTPLFRIIHFGSGTTVNVKGLTISHGLLPINDDDGGGGIVNFGTLAMEDCVVSDSSAGNVRGGGGIRNVGTLTMTNCTVRDNRTSDGATILFGAMGGGIFTSGTLTMRNSTVTGNRTGTSNSVGPFAANGGGIAQIGGTLTMTDSTVSNNRAGDGVTGDTSGIAGSGGGIALLDGTANLTGCTVSGNRTGDGGDTTSSTGSQAGGGGGSGGGIYNRGDAGGLTLTNCTLSGNRTGNGGDRTAGTGEGGGGGAGGGVFTSRAATFTGCTITDNHTGIGGNGPSRNGSGGFGGGSAKLGGMVIVRNTIIAGNTVPVGGNTVDVSQSYVSQGYNLIGVDNGIFTQPTDQTGTLASPLDPKLGPLASNGGPTQTHALLLSSPAIDKGKNFFTDSGGNPILKDQRGQSRPVDLDDSAYPDAAGGDGSDIGAYELLLLPAAAGQLLISEFRFSGANDQDEFVELYNNTDSDIVVNVADGSAGWALVSFDAGSTNVRMVIPNFTVIPARGHYLGATSPFIGGYNLTGYAVPDKAMTAHISNGAGLAIFITSNPANFTLANRLDAVGYDGVTDPIYFENTPLPPTGGIAPTAMQYSWVRDMSEGRPKDTDNNAVDFRLVSTDGDLFGGVQSTLGAPGPENLSSPVERNSQFSLVLLDAITRQSNFPNRVRDLTSDPANNSTFGTMTIRRRLTNNTGASVTRLRFRVIVITGFPVSHATNADLRVRSVAGTVVNNVQDTASCAASALSPPCTVNVEGTTLEEPPFQPNGGGVNSSLSVPVVTSAPVTNVPQRSPRRLPAARGVPIPNDTITLGAPLAAGQSLNVQFLLGVQQTGTFRFLVIIEALP